MECHSGSRRKAERTGNRSRGCFADELSGSDAFAKETCDGILFPYENAEGMQALKNAADGIANGQKIAVFIGPEGGFSDAEITCLVEKGAVSVSLGPRILRTETAGLAALSVFFGLYGEME